uniref:Uncharacterized protein LOC111133523 n=1 Tax=Crassostrea virginica TaxID=6565 RepID=A0A8B8EAM3_CRAVI|nr:uncharacterized protein LOC111133523 [Crassostrea virginica]
MLKPTTADHNVGTTAGRKRERWKMETNLTDDVKVRLGSSENAATLADGTGIRQVTLPKLDSEGLLPCCYEKEDTENISPKFNLNRHIHSHFNRFNQRNRRMGTCCCQIYLNADLLKI